MIKLGLTGTIASGKSEVASILKERGIPVFNSDECAKEVYKEDNKCYKKVIKLLGEDIVVRNKVDYHKVSEIIFNDETIRKALNNIIHPYVRSEMKKFFNKHKKEEIVCAEVPLLFEAKLEEEFDKILVITSSKEIAFKRMKKYRAYTKKECEKRYNSQIDPKIQILKGDFVIYNDTTIKNLKVEVDRVLEEINGN